jgi:hypothetical protein
VFREQCVERERERERETRAMERYKELGEKKKKTNN